MTRALVVLLVLRCWCNSLVDRHRAARCDAPAGWFVTAAKSSGQYELDPVLGSKENDLLDAWLRKELEGPEPVRGRLYCTGGATLRQDGLSVWCQR